MPFQYRSVFGTLFSPKNLIGFDIFLKMNEMVIVENWPLCQLIQNAALMFLYWIHILFSSFHCMLCNYRAGLKTADCQRDYF